MADDLNAARIALRGLSPGWSVVTVGGEIARSSGTVTGGSRVKESGALARERELRELPKLRAKLEVERDELSEQIEGLDTSLLTHNQDKTSIEQDLASIHGEIRDLTATRERYSRDLSDLEKTASAAEASLVQSRC